MNWPCVASTKNGVLKLKNPAHEPWCAPYPICHKQVTESQNRKAWTPEAQHSQKYKCQMFTMCRTPNPEIVDCWGSDLGVRDLGLDIGDEKTMFKNV
jgi:hypothetical protein